MIQLIPDDTQSILEYFQFHSMVLLSLLKAVLMHFLLYNRCTQKKTAHKTAGVSDGCQTEDRWCTNLHS